MSGILGIGGGGDTGFYPYALDQSVRFNDGDAARLQRTPSSTGSNTDWTISFWIKRCTIGTTQDVIDVGATGDTNSDTIQFRTDDTIRIQNDGSAILHTNYKFRDVSAWYHIVVKSDADNGTAANKLKVYINGIDQDDTANGGAGFGVDNRSSFSSWAEFGSTDPMQIGARIWNNGNNLDAYLAEFNYLDGVIADASSFGETKNGIWIPKQYTGSYGTNGFRLTFEDDTTVEGFNTVTYTGTQAVRAISGVGFQPDLVWIKRRSASADHALWDSVRGTQKWLLSNGNNAEISTSDGLSSFDGDGFTLGADATYGSWNNSGTYVAWCWDAGTGSASSNTNGTVTSTVKANTDYGFSIATFTGGAAGYTVGHGLSQAPEIVFTFNRTDTAGENYVFTTAIDGSIDYLSLGPTGTNTKNDDPFSMPAFTSSVFSLDNDYGMDTGDNCVAYCFHSVSGYSKIGSYSGNGSSGHAITTGFEPAWLMVKRTDVANSWFIVDNTRTVNTAAGNDDLLYANLSDAEGSTNDFFTFTSTGFELNTSSPAVNASGGTYIYMAFADTREYAFWTDQSGNNNDFQHTNLEHTDVVPDRPTNNFCVVNDLSDVSNIVLSDGNLNITNTVDSWPTVRGTIGVSSGKWYYEVVSTDTTRWGAGWATKEFQSGTTFSNSIGDGLIGYSTDPLSVYDFGTGRSINGSPAFSASTPQNNILQVAIDIDAGKFWLGINNTYVNNSSGSAGNPSAGTNELETFTAGTEMFPSFLNNGGNLTINFGQDSTFSGLKTAGGNTDANGNGDFFYAPPTGFLALCTDNLPNPGIDPNDGETPDEYFNTVLYTGTGAENAVTGVGFAPDFCWFKNRSDNSTNHLLFDSVRGATKTLRADTTGAETTNAQKLKSFDSDGFTLGTDSNPNGSTKSFVAWNWKAGGTASSNTDGTITTSVSASPESGFSVFTYTGTGSTDSVGHGLGITPKLVIFKNRDSSSGWLVLTTAIDGTTDYVTLNATDTKSNLDTYSMTSSVVNFSGASTPVNLSGNGHVAYAFAEIEGYSKIGSYTGNGSTDGAFVYTGFRPAFVMCKRTDVANSWPMFDNKRDVDNEVEHILFANLSDDELSPFDRMDFTSNGFKLRDTSSGVNNSGGTFIYMAFAEQPFKYANAR